MTTQVHYVDRDEYLAMQRAEQIELELESEIDKLVRQLTRAREELRMSEEALAAVEESLAGRKQV